MLPDETECPHDNVRVTYEDEELLQQECEDCGAELDDIDKTKG